MAFALTERFVSVLALLPFGLESVLVSTEVVLDYSHYLTPHRGPSDFSHLPNRAAGLQLSLQRYHQLGALFFMSEERSRERKRESSDQVKSAMWINLNEGNQSCSDCGRARQEDIFTWPLGYLRPSWDAGWPSLRATCSFSSWYVVSGGTDRVMVCV